MDKYLNNVLDQVKQVIASNEKIENVQKGEKRYNIEDNHLLIIGVIIFIIGIFVMVNANKTLSIDEVLAIKRSHPYDESGRATLNEIKDNKSTGIIIGMLISIVGLIPFYIISINKPKIYVRTDLKKVIIVNKINPLGATSALRMTSSTILIDDITNINEEGQNLLINTKLGESFIVEKTAKNLFI